MEGKSLVFTKGMHADNDPRYQPEGTYRDAENVKLVSRDGNTYTIENVEGTRFTLDIPCASNAHVLQLNTSGSTNNLIIDRPYQFTIHYTDFDINGTQGVDRSFVVPTVAVSGVDYYPFDNTQGMCEMFANEINAIKTNNNNATGQQIFTAHQNGTEVVIKPEEILDTTGLGTGNHGVILSFGAVPGSATGGITNGFSHNTGTVASPTNVDVFGTNDSNGNDTEITVPVFHYTRFQDPLTTNTSAPMCDLSIIGHYSFLNTLYLFTYDSNWTSGSPYLSTSNGQIWQIEFDNAGRVISTDLKYNNALEFDKSRKLIVEGIIENDCITRLYWTDNFNPIRSLNLTDPNHFAFSLDDLKMSPETSMDRPILKRVGGGGNLEVGMYQVAYKLITKGGAKSSLSPMSQLISIASGDIQNNHLVNNGSGTGKADQGTITSKSFDVEVQYIDIDFDEIEFYVLVFETYNSAPTKIMKSNTFSIPGNTFIFTHTNNNLIDVDLAEILVDGNTFDTAKDIAVKDNRLFAANLSISAKDLSTFDTEVYRWKPVDVKPTENVTTWDNLDFTSGGTLPNGIKTKNPAITSDYKYLPFAVKDRSNNDQLVQGAQTKYFDSTNGGVRITFQTESRIVDTETQYSYFQNKTFYGNNPKAPYGDAGYPVGIQRYFKDGSGSSENNKFVEKNDTNTSFNSAIDDHTDNINTFYQSEGYDGNQNPYIAYDSRGYTRGETYRFAIALYDNNNKQIQTRYIGDITMPEHSDQQWKFFGDDKKQINDINTVHWSDFGTTPSTAYTSPNTVSSGYNIYDNDSANRVVTKNIYAEDFRLSYVKGGRNPYNDYENHTSVAVGMNAASFPFWKPAASASHASINEVPLQNNSDYRYPNGGSGSVTGDKTYGVPNFNHYVQDLHLRFEIIIPKSLKNIIGGYKIVRVKREQKDKTIIGQGILTQSFWAQDIVDSSDGIGLGFDSDSLGGGNWHGGHDDMENLDQNREDWTTKIDERYIPFCNPFHRQVNSVGPLVKNTQSAGIGRLQTAYSTLPNIDDPDIPSHNLIQGQMSLCDGGNKTSGFNRYWTIDSPDFQHMSNGFVSQPGLSLDIISVLKQVDSQRVRNWAFGNNTDFGGNHSPGGHVNRPGIGTTHGRRWMHDVEFKSNGERTVDDSAPEYYHTKYETYDTKSFAFPRSIVNLRGGGSTVPTNYSGIANYFLQKTLSLNSSTIADYGQQIFPNGIAFSNNNTDYMLWNNGAVAAPSIPAFCSAWLSPTGALDGVHLSNKWRQSSVGKCAKTVFLEIEEINNDDQVLVVPDLDRFYINSHDLPHMGPTTATSFIGHPFDKSESFVNGRVPYTLLANLTKEVVNQYGGKNESAISKNRFIEVGHFTFVNKGTNISEVQTSKITGGDTFVQFYAKEKYNGSRINKESLDIDNMEEYELQGGNNVGWYFPVETYVNTDLLHGTKKMRDEVFTNYPVNDFDEYYNTYVKAGEENNDYNEVYSQESDAKSHLVTSDENCVVTKFPNMVAYSNVKSIGETQYDAWKKFDLADFHDTDGVHGPINNLFVLNDYMYFFQSQAVGMLEVNPKTIIPTQDGSQLYTGSGDTIENHSYITTKYGSQHQHSLVLSDTHSYFIDAINEKMFSFDGKKIESISDTKGMANYMKSILNGGSTNSVITSSPNIGNLLISQIKDTDTPLLFKGIHGGYNKETGDIVYTFHDLSKDTSTILNKGTLVYNDRISAYTSKYSVSPNYWISHMHRLFSTENKSFTQTNQQPTSSWTQNQLHEWMGAIDTGIPKRTQFYLNNNIASGVTSSYIDGFFFEAIVNEKPHLPKIFDNIGVVMTMQNWQNVNTTNNDVTKSGSEMVGLSAALGYSTTFEEIEMSTELSDYSNIGVHKIFNSVSPILMDQRVLYREGVLHFPTRAEYTSTDGTNSTLGRLRGTYMKIKFKSTDSTNKFNIFALRPKFRKSYK
tara:strand:+ start:18931 stop:24768 length:5838 start_codon:yes stop_codon:yes gene_type:complete